MKLITLTLLAFLLSNLAACGGSSDEPIIAKNQKPIIQVAQSVSVDELSNISITANANDSDGSIATYDWAQISGPELSLEGRNSGTVSFIAPDVFQDEVARLTLTVTDNLGATATADISVNITFVNQPPIADAGEDVKIFVNESLNLDCSNSHDNDQQTLTYQWKNYSGDVLTITHSDSCSTSVLLSEQSTSTVLELIVSDGIDTSSDYITIESVTYQGENYVLDSNPFTLPERCCVNDDFTNAISSSYIINDGNYYSIVQGVLDVWSLDSNNVTRVSESALEIPELPSGFTPSLANGHFFVPQSQGVLIYEITPAHEFNLIASYDVNEMIWENQPNGFSVGGALTISNQYMYVPYNQVQLGEPGDNQGELYGYQVVDISNIADPKFVSSVNTTEFNTQMSFVSANNGTGYLWDSCQFWLATPTSLDDWSPWDANYCPFNFSIPSVRIVNDNVFTWHSNGTSINLIDLLVGQEPQTISSINMTSGISELQTNDMGNKLFVSLVNDKLVIVDRYERSKMLLSAIYNLDNWHSGFVVDQNEENLIYSSYTPGMSEPYFTHRKKLTWIELVSTKPHSVSTEETHTFEFRLNQPSAAEASCQVTAGSCEVSLNPTDGTLVVRWETGAASGHHELIVLAGSAASVVSKRVWLEIE